MRKRNMKNKDATNTEYEDASYIYAFLVRTAYLLLLLLCASLYLW